MGPRTRTRSTLTDFNKLYSPTGVNYGTSYFTMGERTDDVTGPGDCAWFSVDRWSKSGGTLTSLKNHGSWVYDGTCPCGYVKDNDGSFLHLDLPGPDLSVLASELLKRTNPSRSSAELVVSAAELRELPGLVRESYEYGLNLLGKHIPRGAFGALKKVAKFNLLVQFGIMPMIGDLQKLLQFTDLVDKRVKELDRLMTRGLRRTVSLDSRSRTASGWTVANSGDDCVVNIHVTKVATQTTRGHVRWYVDNNFQLSDQEKKRLAAQLVYGFSFDAYALYEALPWTWLIDYFTNLGDFVSLTRNQIGATHSTPIMMQHTETVTSFPRVVCNNFGIETEISAYTGRFDSKRRFPVSATLSARTGFLTEFQTSILGSLAITRLK